MYDNKPSHSPTRSLDRGLSERGLLMLRREDSSKSLKSLTDPALLAMGAAATRQQSKEGCNSRSYSDRLSLYNHGSNRNDEQEDPDAERRRRLHQLKSSRYGSNSSRGLSPDDDDQSLDGSVKSFSSWLKKKPKHKKGTQRNNSSSHHDAGLHSEDDDSLLGKSIGGGSASASKQGSSSSSYLGRMMSWKKSSGKSELDDDDSDDDFSTFSLEEEEDEDELFAFGGGGDSKNGSKSLLDFQGSRSNMDASNPLEESDFFFVPENHTTIGKLSPPNDDNKRAKAEAERARRNQSARAALQKHHRSGNLKDRDEARRRRRSPGPRRRSPARRNQSPGPEEGARRRAKTSSADGGSPATTKERRGSDRLRNNRTAEAPPDMIWDTDDATRRKERRGSDRRTAEVPPDMIWNKDEDDTRRRERRGSRSTDAPRKERRQSGSLRRSRTLEPSDMSAGPLGKLIAMESKDEKDPNNNNLGLRRSKTALAGTSGTKQRSLRRVHTTEGDDNNCAPPGSRRSQTFTAPALGALIAMGQPATDNPGLRRSKTALEQHHGPKKQRSLRRIRTKEDGGLERRSRGPNKSDQDEEGHSRRSREAADGEGLGRHPRRTRKPRGERAGRRSSRTLPPRNTTC